MKEFIKDRNFQLLVKMFDNLDAAQAWAEQHRQEFNLNNIKCWQADSFTKECFSSMASRTSPVSLLTKDSGMYYAAILVPDSFYNTQYLLIHETRLDADRVIYCKGETGGYYVWSKSSGHDVGFFVSNSPNSIALISKVSNFYLELGLLDNIEYNCSNYL
jgi:hypothetical protein